MAKIILHHGCAPEGASSASCTATLAQVLEGTLENPNTAVTSDSNDQPAAGTLSKNNVLASAGGNIVTKNDSENYSITSNGEIKSYPAGYYPNAHGAVASLSYADW